MVHEPVLSAVQHSGMVTQAVVGRMQEQARLLRSQRERGLHEEVVPHLLPASPSPCFRDRPDVLEECDRLLAFLADDNAETVSNMVSPSVLGDAEPHRSTELGELALPREEQLSPRQEEMISLWSERQDLLKRMAFRFASCRICAVWRSWQGYLADLTLREEQTRRESAAAQAVPGSVCGVRRSSRPNALLQARSSRASVPKQLVTTARPGAQPLRQSRSQRAAVVDDDFEVPDLVDRSSESESEDLPRNQEKLAMAQYVQPTAHPCTRSTASTQRGREARHGLVQGCTLLLNCCSFLWLTLLLSLLQLSPSLSDAVAAAARPASRLRPAPSPQLARARSHSAKPGLPR